MSGRFSVYGVVILNGTLRNSFSSAYTREVINKRTHSFVSRRRQKKDLFCYLIQFTILCLSTICKEGRLGKHLDEQEVMYV